MSSIRESERRLCGESFLVGANVSVSDTALTCQTTASWPVAFVLVMAIAVPLSVDASVRATYTVVMH